MRKIVVFFCCRIPCIFYIKDDVVLINLFVKLQGGILQNYLFDSDEMFNKRSHVGRRQ